MMDVRFKKILLIFLTAFLFNCIWEKLHSFLYSTFEGGAITDSILFNASFMDAVMIGLLALPFLYSKALEKRIWLIIPFGFFMAATIEIYALNTGWWHYNQFMPIIPIIHTGLTPTLQLGVTGYISLLLVTRYLSRNK